MPLAANAHDEAQAVESQAQAVLSPFAALPARYNVGACATMTLENPKHLLLTIWANPSNPYSPK